MQSTWRGRQWSHQWALPQVQDRVSPRAPPGAESPSQQQQLSAGPSLLSENKLSHPSLTSFIETNT